MCSAVRKLSEPQVLAHAKRRLFPAGDDEDAYAVVDTQFATEEWRVDERIDDAVRSSLSPFNHVRVGSGYPDLVGVRRLENELLAVDRFGEEPPLVAVEAKGYAANERVDVKRGVVQARDRLDEANAAYVAAPRRAISGATRTLARELNVGVLGVTADGDVVPMEVPRLVGNRTTAEPNAIRFQASAQGVAKKSFGLNHPKNYLAYPLAVVMPGDTAALVDEHVVGAVESARRGAAFLGLIDVSPEGVSVSSLGAEVVRFARSEYGSLEAALSAFEGWKASRGRFCDVAPRWGLVTRRVVYGYPATQLLVEELQRMHDDGNPTPSLVELVTYLHELHPSFTVELFLRSDEDVRERALTADGDLKPAVLANGGVYHSPTVFQLKAMLYHAGVVTDRGAEPSNLDPQADVWALREPL